jgi:flagellar motor switch protein FliN
MYNKQQKQLHKSLKIKSIDISSIDYKYNKYVNTSEDKSFTFKNKQLKILQNISTDVNNKLPNDSYLLSLKTISGSYYIAEGIQWLQSKTNIYVQHDNADMQDWLLKTALDRLEDNIFIDEILSINVHKWSYLSELYAKNGQKLHKLYLHGLYKNAIYASAENWINLLDKQKFNISNSYNIETIPIYKKIIFAKKKINLEQYTKLIKGNIILVHKSAFDFDGLATLDFDSFLMHVRYDNDQLFFESWSQSMSNNKQDLDDESWDENGENQAINSDSDSEFDFDIESDSETNEEFEQESEDSTNEESEYNDENIDDDNHDNHDNHDNQDNEDSAALAEEEQTKHPFANIPVQLSFNLGYIKMPIESIMQLSEGSILELHKDTPAQVIIYANGKEIGSGEVVDISGKLGVQIIELY